MRKLRWKIIEQSFILFIIACMSFSLAACGKEAAKPAEMVRNVTVGKAEVADIAINVEYPGRIRPLKELAVTSKTAGKVSTVGFDVGDRVEEGQTLFTVETNEAEAQKKQAKIQYDEAKKLYDNTSKLFADGSVPQRQMDDVEAKYKSAGVQLDLANQQLGYSEVTSPISGVVSVRGIDAGEMVSTQVPAFTVIDTGTLTVEISLPDSLSMKLSKGQQVETRIIALDNKSVTGTVESISPAADPKTLGYTVRIQIGNSDGAIKPGMIARILMPAERKEKVLTVPNEAIVVENSVQYVYAADNGIAVRKHVTAGLSDGRITEITDGLTEGEFVILEGQSFLDDGDRVEVAK